MKLVKAMIKSFEDFPKEFFCCEEQINWIKDRQKEGFIIIDLDRINPPKEGISCKYCKSPIDIISPDVFVVESQQNGQIDRWCWISILDIDEVLYIKE